MEYAFSSIYLIRNDQFMLKCLGLSDITAQMFMAVCDNMCVLVSKYIIKLFCIHIDVTFLSAHRGKEQHPLWRQFNLPDGEIKVCSSPGPTCRYSCASQSEQMDQTDSSRLIYLFTVICAVLSDICSGVFSQL